MAEENTVAVSSETHRTRQPKRPVLKCGDMFALFDVTGGFRSELQDEEGLYFDGTRFLSKKFFTLNGVPLAVLGAQVRNDGEELLVHYTNPLNEILNLPENSLSVTERTFLSGETLYVETSVTNFSSIDADLTLSIHVGADYADIYEVRGMARRERGQLDKPKISDDGLHLSYEGLDGETRSTSISFEPSPTTLSLDHAEFTFLVKPGEGKAFRLLASCQRSRRSPSMQQGYVEVHSTLGIEIKSHSASSCVVRTSNSQFDAWWNRSMWDLQLLTTTVSTGKYPYAGIPWFNTPFGRDGLITGLETLWIAPELSRGVLSYLAATQATSVDPSEDAEPGKILHETRSGEMAALQEMPFGRYYGTVDAPPLFVMLAGAYLSRSGDLDFIRSIWPSVLAALQWMAGFGDPDGDGFVEYESHCHGGLVHQAWKDSDDAIFHANGESAKGALALCEVQGYCYAAYLAGAKIADALGFQELRDSWIERARALRDAFNEAYWCPTLNTYGLALDGSKSLCQVATSNAGQPLFTGIVPHNRAAQVARTLMSSRFFSGWGVRTLATDSVRFNPMSYHNGTVWPHDNALIAFGLSRCGLKEQANRIFEGIFDAALRFDLQRLPELFCGFPREDGYGPANYPVACSPQAWASGSVALFLQGSLGIEVDAIHSRIVFDHPQLPPFLTEVVLSHLVVGGSTVNLVVRGHGNRATVGTDGACHVQIIVNS